MAAYPGVARGYACRLSAIGALLPSGTHKNQTMPASATTVSTPPTRTKFKMLRRVLAAGRVVVEAIQQHLVRRRADLVGRRLHQPQPQVAAGKLDAVEIAGDLALRRQDHDAAGVDVLVLLGVVDVAKADGGGQLLDGLGPCP